MYDTIIINIGRHNVLSMFYHMYSMFDTCNCSIIVLFVSLFYNINTIA
jgi:hypothetical protein